MTRLFQNIRRNYLKRGKLRKYILYVAGEILLVVIGILIALRINNANEQTKTNARIQQLLGLVQAELATNIRTGVELMDNHMTKDSLIYFVMQGYPTPEDYRSNRNGLRNLVTEYEIFSIQDEAYTNLIAESKELPPELNVLSSQLKDLYVSQKNSVENADAEVQRIVLRHWDWEITNTEWFSNKYFADTTLAEEQIDFYLNSPYYKNVVYDYFNSTLENLYPSMLSFCVAATKVHAQIAALTEEAKSGPTALYDYPAHYQQAIVGNYDSDIGACHITFAEDRFIFDLNGVKFNIISINEEKFIGFNGMFCYLDRDERGEVMGFTGRYGSQQWVFRRTSQ